MIFEVRKFSYNGFCGMPCPDEPAGYTAEFFCWTRDPGIAVFNCSDGKRRIIPTYALRGEDALPKQDYDALGGQLMFGDACDDKLFLDLEAER